MMKLQISLYPKSLYRDDDGQEFRINKDNKYSIYPADPNNKYPFKYSYEMLIRYGFKTRLKDCNIVPMKKVNIGCGDDE